MHIPDHIHVLIDKYLAGTISVSERQELNGWYHSVNDEEVLVNVPETMTEQQLSDRMESRLVQMLAEEPENQSVNIVSVPRKPRWAWLAASAIFLLISVSIFYFLQSNSIEPIAKAGAQPQPVMTNDVLPGGNKAILTLDDGSSIVLDLADNGTIGKQGDAAVEKLENGQIAYQVNQGDEANTTKVYYNRVSTPRGGEYQITLSDGTRVWLNAASSIRFPTVFTGQERQVEIQGEVYFEVAKNEQQPFIVQAGQSKVKVLGTHFNINAYDDESQIRTSLLEGTVQVMNNNETDAQTLKPGQQARMNNKSGKIKVVNDIDPEEILAWKNGLFVFKSADLRSIMRQVSRWYDVDVEYKGNVGLQFTGQITRKNNVSKILEMLELTGELKFKVDNKKVIVSR